MMKTIDMIDPQLAAAVRAQAIKRAARVAAAKPKATAAAPAKPRTAPKAAARAAVSHHPATARVSTGSNFSHLLDARKLVPPEAPPAPAVRRDIRRPALTREQSAELAKQIVAANNKRLGLTSDTATPDVQTMTPLARRIVEAARRAGIA